jgi:D-glycero-D-manno-heptose 1,7-bisphosphate phosphatase
MKKLRPPLRPGRKPNPESLFPGVPEMLIELRHPRRLDFHTAKPAVFLDRDGTLMEEVDYCRNPKDVHVFPRVQKHLYRLRQAGFLLVVITNQAGIGRGLFTEKEYAKVHREFLAQIGPGLIDYTYYCADHPDHASDRRKPGIGMIREAARDFHIDLAHSWFVGDKASDIACGQNAGLKTILVATGYGGTTDACRPDYRACDIATAVDHILVD